MPDEFKSSIVEQLIISILELRQLEGESVSSASGSPTFTCACDTARRSRLKPPTFKSVYWRSLVRVF